MTKQRIDFLSVDAARFNALREEWRGVASGGGLSKAGLRVAAVLPGFVSREFGYAFPTDEDLAGAIQTTDPSTAKRGLLSLEGAHLIDRQTIVKRDQKGEAIGRLRRIYLTMPDVKVQNASDVKVQDVKVQPDVKVQKRRGEGAYGCTNIPDRITPDNSNGSGQRKHGAMPAREGCPVGYTDDFDFLDAFDRTVVEMTDRREIAAGEIGRIVQEAFDQTTGSSPLFMPFFWSDVCNLRKKDTEEWFRRRAGQLIHRRAAA